MNRNITVNIHGNVSCCDLDDLCGLTHKRRKGHFNFKIGMPTLKEERINKMIGITINNEQKINVTLAPVTPGGKPAPLDGAPAWSVISGDSTVVPATDGLSAFLVSSDTPGDTVYLVEADADLGSGVVTISDTITLTVEGAKAAALGLVVGTAEPK